MNTVLSSLVATIAFALTGSFAQAQPVASDPSSSSRHIEGVWDEHVTIVNCANGAPIVTFRATNLFASGGALTAVNNNSPATTGPTLGTWWRVSRHGDFGAKMRFFRFNPDGTYAGYQEITRAIFVDPDGQSLSGTVTYQTFDANDNLIQSGCSTEVGARVS